MDPLLVFAVITLVTCIVVTAVVFASWRYRPTVWAGDIGLPRTTDPVGGAVVAAIVVLIMLGGAVAASVATIDEFGFVGAAIAGWALVVVFSLWDFLIIDWLVFIGLKPSWFHLDGMENAPQIYEWQHHAKESIPGIFLGIPIGVIAAGIAALAN
ncbi:MAG: hypothetical protein AAF467_25930 [Actinomycetota bacterium]